MGTISGQDRRKAQRAERDLPLRLYAAGRPLPDAQLRDVSTEGFGVQVAAELKPGQALAFELQLAAGKVAGSAAVVWAEPFHMGYRGGARITKLGFFARRRLKRAIAGDDSPEGFLDTVLIALAAVLFAAVAVDFFR